MADGKFSCLCCRQQGFFEKSKRTQTTKFAHNICEFCLNLFVNNFFYFANFFTQQYTSKSQHFAVPHPLLPLLCCIFIFISARKTFRRLCKITQNEAGAAQKAKSFRRGKQPRKRMKEQKGEERE